MTTKNRHFLYFILPFFILSSCSPSFNKYEEKAKAWENEIQQLEAQDRTKKYADNSLLFIGSSSIRLWKSLEDDMAPYPVIQRGYGGAKFSDLIFYTDRLVSPHKFRAVVVFVANDITGSAEDKTPKEVVQLFKKFVSIVREKNPTKPIFLVEITPTNSRWAVWDKTKETNSLLKSYCESQKKLYFIETADAFLGKEGKPESNLFVDDQLHLSKSGYKIWTEIIKKRLDQVLGAIE